MELDNFVELLFEKAKQAGIESCDVFFLKKRSLMVSVLKKEIKEQSINDSLKLYFRCIINRKLGSAFTEILDDKAIEFLIINAKDNAMLIQNNDFESIYGEKCNYLQVDTYAEGLSCVSMEQMIELAYRIEEEAYRASNDVRLVKSSILKYFESIHRIINSNGLNLTYHNNWLQALVTPIVSRNEKKTVQLLIVLREIFLN